MSRLCLVVETPCGGDSGHRFLTSCADLNERDIARISADALRTPVGRNYISVSREVTQSLKNSTIRTGTEQIVLHGVGTGDIEPPDIADVQDALRGLFESLGELTDTIDWRSAGKSTVIVRSEMLQWLDRFEHMGIPRSDAPTQPNRPTQNLELKGKRQPRRRPIKWMFCAAGLVVSIVIASISIRMLINAGTDCDPSPPKTPHSAVFQELVQEWNCTSDELGVSLLRAANWDKREEAERLGRDFALADGEVLAIIDKLNAHKQPHRFFVSPAVESEYGFRRVFDHRVKSAADAIALRQWLFESWQAFSILKQSAIRAKKYLHENDGELAGFIKRVSGIEGDVGIGDGFQAPKTPLFDRQDMMIFQLLGKDIRQTLSDAGVLRRVLAVGGEVEPDDLSSLLSVLSKHREEMTRVIRESRKDVVDRVRASRGDGDYVFATYEKCEQFLLQLSDYDSR